MDAYTATGSLECTADLQLRLQKTTTQLWLFCLVVNELLYAVFVS